MALPCRQQRPDSVLPKLYSKSRSELQPSRALFSCIDQFNCLQRRLSSPTLSGESQSGVNTFPASLNGLDCCPNRSHGRPRIQSGCMRFRWERWLRRSHCSVLFATVIRLFRFISLHLLWAAARLQNGTRPDSSTASFSARLIMWRPCGEYYAQSAPLCF